MFGIKEISKILTFRGVGNSKEADTDTPDSESSTSAASDFSSILSSFLNPDQANSVSEEDLFASVIGERVNSLKGDEAGTKFKEYYDQQKQAMAKADGYVPLEAAAREALKQLTSDGTLTSEEADKIHSEAFQASQLDDKTEFLYDGRGDTQATATLEKALESAKAILDKIAAGEVALQERPLSETTYETSLQFSGSNASVGTASTGISGEGNPNDGNEGFLFKPESNNQGTLAVLVPSSALGEVSSIILRDENGQEIESGHVTSWEAGREKYSFSKPGSQYPENLTVEVTMSDGTVTTYKIPDPSQRYD